MKKLITGWLLVVGTFQILEAQEIIYQEHFEEKKGAWSVRPEVKAVVKAKDGKLRIASEDASYSTVIDFKDFVLPENFSVELTTEWNGRKGDAVYGFGFGWNPFRILVFNDGYLRVNFWSTKTNKWERPLEKFAGKTPYQTAAGSVNRLKLVCYDKKAEFFVNDVSVGTFTAFFAEKFFQLVVEGQEDILFDDVVIKKLPPKVAANQYNTTDPIITSPEGYKTTMNLDLDFIGKTPAQQLIDSFVCDGLSMKVNPLWKLNNTTKLEREIYLGVKEFGQLKATFPATALDAKRTSMMITLNIQDMTVEQKKKGMANLVYMDMLQYYKAAGVTKTKEEYEKVYKQLSEGEWLTTNQGLKGEFFVFNWISEVQTVCWFMMMIPKDDKSIYFASVSLKQFIKGSFTDGKINPDIGTAFVFPDINEEDKFKVLVRNMFKTITVPK